MNTVKKQTKKPSRTFLVRNTNTGVIGIFAAILAAAFSIGAVFFPETLLDLTVGGLFNGLMQVIFSILGILLAVAGWLVDVSVKFSLNTGNYAMKAVQAGWTVLRDIANITFIFILLYVAIGTILRLEKINTKQALVNVIIIAFLINFSLFFTQIIIDFTNILATFFYNNIVSVTVNEQSAGLGTIFTSLLNPQALFEADQFAKLNNFSTGLAYMFGSVGLLLTIFSLLAVAIMFIARIAVLMLLMVLSPVAFVAYILDDFREHFNTWWKTLLSQSFFAPAYLLVAYTVVVIVYELNATVFKKGQGVAAAIGTAENIRASGSVISQTAASGSSVDSFSIFFTYLLILFLINGALIIAKRLGGATATFGTKWAGKGLGAAMGATAFGLRHTAGRAFGLLTRAKGFKDFAERTPFGRTIYEGAEGLSKAAYDFRGGRAGDLLGAGAGVIGADFGKAGGKGGYEAIRKAQVEGRTKFAEYLSKDPGGAERVASYQKSLAEGSTLSRGILGRMSGLRGVQDEVAGKIAETTQKELEGKEAKSLRKELASIISQLKTEKTKPGGGDPVVLANLTQAMNSTAAQINALQPMADVAKQLSGVQEALSRGGGRSEESPKPPPPRT